MNPELIAVVALLVAASAAWLIQRQRAVIRLDENGVLVVRSFAKPLYLSWNEIDRFGVASVCRIEGGLHQIGSEQFVGVELNASSALKHTKACVDNRKLSDYDVLLTPERGMTVERFAAHLEHEKRKFEKVRA